MEKIENKKESNRRPGKIKLILPLMGIVIGIIIILLPFILDIISKGKSEAKITSMTARYDNYVENSEEIEKQLEQARLYNRALAGENIEGILSYEDQLSFDGDGIMGWIEIPKADIKMLIYHGTSDEVLAIGAGHLQGTSLPVGGKSTHCVITAHSGMKNMKAFDNLRKLTEGDYFTITIFGKPLRYQVKLIETVLPYEIDSLSIVEGEDMVTLVTCTPYGINDHRLLVHAVRT